VIDGITNEVFSVDEIIICMENISLLFLAFRLARVDCFGDLLLLTSS
jgi:hypothetical protein